MIQRKTMEKILMNDKYDTLQLSNMRKKNRSTGKKKPAHLARRRLQIYNFQIFHTVFSSGPRKEWIRARVFLARGKGVTHSVFFLQQVEGNLVHFELLVSIKIVVGVYVLHVVFLCSFILYIDTLVFYLFVIIIYFVVM